MEQQRDAVNDRWTRLMTAARQRWDRLSEDDVQSVRGNTERLITVLQTRYGFARAQAIKELTSWRQALRSGAAA